MRRIAIGISILFSCILTTKATEPYFILREFDEAYTHISINLIYQDQNSMIWLGTSNGLMQYNGEDLIPIPHNDSTLHEEVTAIYEDRDGTIWVGTESGTIYRYDAREGLKLWAPEEGLPKKRITGFQEDGLDQLWISTYGEGIYVVSKGRMYNINTNDSLPDDDVYMITRDGKGRIWAGTDNGVAICSFDKAKSVVSLSVREGLPDQIVRAMIPDRYGNMWIATYDAGIVYYDIEKAAITRTISDQNIGHITCLGIFEDVEIWIGTEGNGVWRYSLVSGRFQKIQRVDQFQNADVRDLLKDVEGNLWVVSSPNALHTAYRSFESLEIPIGSIQSIHVSTPEQVWIGTDDGLYKAWNDIAGSWSHLKIAHAPFSSVACLGEDQYGNIWIGSLDYGLCAFDPGTQRFRTFPEHKELHQNPVVSLIIEDETIWLATLGSGVIKAKLQGDVMNGSGLSMRLLTEGTSYSHYFVFQLMPKEPDNVWLATDGAGLAYTDGVSIETLESSQPLPKKIYSIARDATGHIWMATQKDGLIEFDGKSSRPLRIEDGLRSLNIASMILGPNDELLIAHSKGIDIMIPSRRHFMYFDDEIGLNSVTPVLNAVSRDAEGNVWIGMKDKLIKYCNLQEDLSIHPKTRIENISVNEQPVDFHSVTTFPANQNFFAFDYIGLWYTSPSIVKYQYTLKGHDLIWKETQDHLAIYSNLKPGEYVFQVKASENKSFSDEPFAEYTFKIEKPFWQEIWFIIFVTVFAIALIYFLIESREKRLRRIVVLNKEKIESQLRALQAQINPHFLFNSFNTLITIIDENAGNPDVPIEFVQKLSDFYRSILQYKEEEVISIPEEITLVKNYYYLLQHRYGNNLKLKVDVDHVQGFVPPLTLQMLVENAVKHNVISKANPLVISIYEKNNEYIVVENNLQKKISETPSTRFGLRNIVNRYGIISDKQVTIEESASSFKVSIPIIKTN